MGMTADTGTWERVQTLPPFLAGEDPSWFPGSAAAGHQCQGKPRVPLGSHRGRPAYSSPWWVRGHNHRYHCLSGHSSILLEVLWPSNDFTFSIYNLMVTLNACSTRLGSDGLMTPFWLYPQPHT